MRCEPGELTFLAVQFVRRLYKEPIVHFMAIGAVIFGVAGLRARNDAVREIVVTREMREQIASELARGRAEAPSAEEVEEAVRRYRREEALYREGLRLGVDRGDPEIRARVVANVLALQKRLFVAPEPRREELDAWLERNRRRYEVAPRYDFEHVFASREHPDAKGRAAGFVRELAGSASPKPLEPGAPAELGDRFADGSAFVAQTEERIRQMFGASFAGELPKLPVGRWTLLESEHGWHAVRLRLKEGGLPPREILEPKLVEDYRSAALENALSSYGARVESAYGYREER